MNINPISFGKSVRVQAPYVVAKQAVELINEPLNENKSQIQTHLKGIFPDYRYGAAILVEPRIDEFYILTGKEANQARLAKEKMEDVLDCAYKETDCLECSELEAEVVQEYKDELDTIISGRSEFPEYLFDENTTEEESDFYFQTFAEQQDLLDSYEFPTINLKYNDEFEIVDTSFYFEK